MTATMAERNCSGTNLLPIRRLCRKERGRRNARFDANRQLTIGLVPYARCAHLSEMCLGLARALRSRLVSQIDQHGYFLSVKVQVLQRVHVGNSE